MATAWTAVDWALLLLRVTIGVVFIAHGLPKAVTETAKYQAAFARMGIPFPSVMVRVVGWLQVAGGLLVIAGILVQPLAVPLAGTMAVAIWKAKWKRGFVNESDFPLLMLVVCIALALAGAGAIAPTFRQIR